MKDSLYTQKSSDPLSVMEKAIILGIIPLIGLTTGAYTALAGMINFTVLFFAVFFLSWVLKTIHQYLYWLILTAAAYAVGLFMTELIYYVLPVKEGARYFLQLAGLMPIIFYPAVNTEEGHSLKKSLGVHIYFLAVLLVMGVVRELLGNGTLFNYGITSSFTIFAGVFSKPAGAIFLLGLMVLGARIWDQRNSRHSQLPQAGAGTANTSASEASSFEVSSSTTETGTISGSATASGTASVKQSMKGAEV